MLIIDCNNEAKSYLKKEYRYVRRNITEIQDSTTLIQVGELELLNSDNTKFSRPSGTSITCNRTMYPSPNNIEMLIDGSVYTKMAVKEPQTYPVLITIDMKTKVDFTNIKKWRRYNGNDTNSYRGRVPRAYTLELSKDGSSRDVVDTVTNAYTPSYSNYGIAYTGNITF